MAKETVKIKARRILRRFPKRQKGTGLLYKGRIPSATKKFNTITVFAILVSNEGDVLLRDHKFGFVDGGGRTRAGWKAWLDNNYMDILRDTIFGTYEEQFGGFWRLHTMIGWTLNANKRAGNTLPRKKRNKAKRKGRRHV